MFAHQGDKRTIIAPDYVFHWRAGKLCNRLLLLNIVQYNGRRRAQDEAGCATIEDLICLDWWFDSLDYGVRQIANFNKLFPEE
jgi:hypothetical protein